MASMPGGGDNSVSTPPVLPHPPLRALGRQVASLAAAIHAATLDTRPLDYTEPVRTRLQMARYVLAEDYVRALTLTEGKLQVNEQFRARDDANYVASVVMDLSDAPGPEVVLWDQGTNALQIMARNDDGTFALESSLEIPRFVELLPPPFELFLPFCNERTPFCNLVIHSQSQPPSHDPDSWLPEYDPPHIRPVFLRPEPAHPNPYRVSNHAIYRY